MFLYYKFVIHKYYGTPTGNNFYWENTFFNKPSNYLKYNAGDLKNTSMILWLCVETVLCSRGGDPTCYVDDCHDDDD